MMAQGLDWLAPAKPALYSPFTMEKTLSLQKANLMLQGVLSCDGQGCREMPGAPVGGQQVLPSPAVRDVIVPEPPVAGSMVVAQRPHDIAVIVHVHRIRLRYRGHCVHAVLERVVHIPAQAEPRCFECP